MHIWAIGDLHLSFGIPDKSMDIFGLKWKDHAEKIASNWRELISHDDLVLIPGDISWAMKPEDAIPDLEWIDSLPGTKVMIKGNHDFWWGSYKKARAITPPSIHLIQNNTFLFQGIAIGGARLWDTPEYSFNKFVEFQENPKAKKEELVQEDLNQNIFNRELERLKLSLKEMDKEANIRIAMTHYPPIGAEMKPSRASQILEENNIDLCVFGHLHNFNESALSFGEHNGVRYFLTSCDYLHFKPIKLL